MGEISSQWSGLNHHGSQTSVDSFQTGLFYILNKLECAGVTFYGQGKHTTVRLNSTPVLGNTNLHERLLWRNLPWCRWKEKWQPTEINMTTDNQSIGATLQKLMLTVLFLKIRPALVLSNCVCVSESKVSWVQKLEINNGIRERTISAISRLEKITINWNVHVTPIPTNPNIMHFDEIYKKKW